MTASTLDFTLAPERIATLPPDAEGRPRDDVALLVSTAGGDRHHRFADLPRLLSPGDLLVVNDSATLPVAVDVPGSDEVVHLSTVLPDGTRLVEMRHRTGFGTAPGTTAAAGRRIALPDGGSVELVAAWPDVSAPDSRLWRAVVDVPAQVESWLRRHGHPVRYGDAAADLPLSAYQTVFARRPGSAEMPSAARPLSPAVLDGLRRRGVAVHTITLHTALSSPERDEPPQPEWYRVPVSTAGKVNRVRRDGGRVIAVGTSVVRTLATVEVDVRAGSRVRAGSGITNLVLSSERPTRLLDGLLTGFHEPEASHLGVLEAVAGTALVARAYAAALDGPYRWHEFGDSHLLLP